MIFSCCSAAKAPFLARFKVRRCGVTELENIGMMPDEEEDDWASSSGPASASVVAASDRRFSIFHPSSSDIRPGHWQAAIFKVGDDVRQVMAGCIILVVFFYSTGCDPFFFTNLVKKLGKFFYPGGKKERLGICLGYLRLHRVE